ncbi:MAG TPA: molybdopterin-synthase adenylyltransferase MoeB [Vicinamibacteria bacterium]|nr:molybdopterin-synthase adenylyltransferase MoeB [Vicinamibacteria bacterium]
MSTFKEMIRRVKSEIREVSPEEASTRAERAVFVDVREADEWEKGHVPGALFIPRGFLELRIEEQVPDKDREVIVYCAGGTRSALGARALQDLGYRNVSSMSGGFGRWRESGLGVRVPKVLSAEQKERYSRHIKVPEVGEAGQARLLESKVLLVGAGGLGCPAGLYLAAAGVGTLGIADFDVVDLSNLQRQVLHTNDSVGEKKTASAEKRLRALNPDVKVVRHDERLEASNVMDVIAPYDLVIDGCDNFSTKYLINDAAVLAGKTSVYGSIFRFEGQMSVFVPRQGPCYRCLFPEATPSELAPSCDEAGVLGVLPGVVGLIQATEAVKILLGKGEPLRGRLLTYDALAMTFREYKVRRDPRCAVCGDAPTIREVADLEWSCHVDRPRPEAAVAAR